MLPYWLLFSYFALGTLITRSRERAASLAAEPALIFGALIIVVMVGLRLRVGADWQPYVRMFRLTAFTPLDSLVQIGEPGYMSLNWAVRQVGGDLWLVNLICAAIFTRGLYKLARIQPYPWMAMLLAVPYLVIVVAMGYTRQAAAIGILSAALADLCRGGSIFRFVISIGIAALFHRTVIIALALVLVGVGETSFINLLIILVGSLLLYTAMLQSHLDAFISNYISARYSAQGALLRSTVNVVSATTFLFFRKRLGFNDIEMRIWRNTSLAAIALFAALPVVPSSAAIDRIALYLAPLQIVVLSRLSLLLKSDVASRALVIAYSFVMLYVWLNYADNAAAWIPYRIQPVL